MKEWNKNYFYLLHVSGVQGTGAGVENASSTLLLLPSHFPNPLPLLLLLLTFIPFGNFLTPPPPPPPCFSSALHHSFMIVGAT